MPVGYENHYLREAWSVCEGSRQRKPSGQLLLGVSRKAKVRRRRRKVVMANVTKLHQEKSWYSKIELVKAMVDYGRAWCWQSSES